MPHRTTKFSNPLTLDFEKAWSELSQEDQARIVRALVRIPKTRDELSSFSQIVSVLELGRQTAQRHLQIFSEEQRDQLRARLIEDKKEAEYIGLKSRASRYTPLYKPRLTLIAIVWAQARYREMIERGWTGRNTIKPRRASATSKALV